MKTLLSIMFCMVALYSNPVNNQGLVKEAMVGEVQIEETKKIVDPWEQVLAAMTIENGKVVSYDPIAFLEIDSHYIDKIAGVYTDGEFYHYFTVDGYYHHESVENPKDMWTKYKGSWQRRSYLDVIDILREDPEYGFEMIKKETFIIIPGGLIDSSGDILKRIDY